ncbi:MAG: hypothetical protein ACREAE_07910 [Nitrosopumilaceae archaeon]
MNDNLVICQNNRHKTTKNNGFEKRYDYVKNKPTLVIIRDFLEKWDAEKRSK